MSRALLTPRVVGAPPPIEIEAEKRSRAWAAGDA
jgi:hypothetical protein